jgi:hypothetical protein
MTFNKYAQYPTVPGIINVRDRSGQHLFTMYTDNIRVRVTQIDKEHIKGTYGPGRDQTWSNGRKTVSQAAGILVWDYIEMPNTSRDMLKTIAEAMDKESLSKQVDEGNDIEVPVFKFMKAA